MPALSEVAKRLQTLWRSPIALLVCGTDPDLAQGFVLWCRRATHWLRNRIREQPSLANFPDDRACFYVCHRFTQLAVEWLPAYQLAEVPTTAPYTGHIKPLELLAALNLMRARATYYASTHSTPRTVRRPD
jgi:hypothetical protein